MILKIQEADFSDFDIPMIIKRNEINITNISENRWMIDMGNKKLILSKGSDIFEYLNIEQSKSSIKPDYSIVDEENFEITSIIKRSQAESGSTYQKLPYGGFMQIDYNNKYSNNENKFHFNIAIIINEYFYKIENEKFNDLLFYVKNNQNIKIWKNELKLI